MADVITTLSDLIDPEVMADSISAKVEEGIRVLPYAKIDTTLEGQAGSSITLPKFGYIGDAIEAAEGEDIPTRALEATSNTFDIKKIGVGGILTDEAVLSGYGNPVGELTSQMAKSILNKTDFDGIEELLTAPTSYVATTIIGYKAIVNAIDAFDEEENSEKVIFVNPAQVTQLRLDPDFISKDKYDNNVMVKGEIGMVANTRVIASKKVSKETIEETIGETTYSKEYWVNPIVKLTSGEEEDEAAALTVYLKRDTNIETQRISKKRITEITGDKLYVVALSDDSKVVLLKALVIPMV
jgi:N4-gp56 family major capsid protein